MPWTDLLENVDLSPWPTSSYGWWASTTWIADSHPSLARRAKVVFEKAGLSLRPHLHALPTKLWSQQISKDLLPLMSLGPGAGGFELSALREHVRRLRLAHDEVGLERLELATAVLDATNRFLAGNPFLAAVDAMPWGRIPHEHADFAVDLGLLARQWCIGRNDVPPAVESMKVGIDRVIAFIHRELGITGDLRWNRELERATSELGTKRMVGGWAYLLGMLERLPPMNPRNLEIYEALADELHEDRRASIEQAIAVFVDALGSPGPKASAALRAAIRRVISHDEVGAFERGNDAFQRMIGIGDHRGACCAAVLLASICKHDTEELGRWLEQSLDLARKHETDVVQVQLLCITALHKKDVGDEIGQRRLLEEAHELTDIGLEIWRELSVIWQQDRTPPARAKASLPAELDQIGRELRQGAWRSAYETLGTYIGELLESHDDDAVVHILLGHVAQLDEQSSIALELLRAWLCAAVTELVEDDHETWWKYKALQLDLEDRLGVTEDLVVVGARPDRRSTLLDFFETITEGEWPDQRSHLDLRGRATQCIAEAEQAIRQGQTKRARFWVERAQRYRSLMDGP